ncbi:DUF1538 domain-containing protein [Streptohalobacillus salinus]
MLKETLIEVLSSFLPLSLIIILLQFTVVFLPTQLFVDFLLGALMASVGIYLFLLGIQVGLSPVGEMVGSALSKTGKLSLVLFFGFLLGFVVTVAEPGVQVLSNQVEFVSDGVVPGVVLLLFVALGVGIFVALSLLRLVFNLSLVKLLASGYLVIFVLALVTPNTFVPIALDAGGATTGAMAVPFILSLGVGVTAVLRGKANSGESFGLIALSSIGPVIAVLLLGVIYG